MQMQKRAPKGPDLVPIDIEGGSSELDTMVVHPYSINIVHPEDPNAIVEGVNPAPAELEVVKKLPEEVKKPKEADVKPLTFREKWGMTIIISCIGKWRSAILLVPTTTFHN